MATERLPGWSSDSIQFFAVVRQNILALLGLPVCLGLLGLYLAFAQQPTYLATTLLQLDPKPTRALGSAEDFYDPGYDSFTYYGTQLTILESRKLAKALVERLDMVNIAEFGGSGLQQASWAERLASWLPGTPDAPEAQAIPADERLEATIARVQKASSSSLAPNTTLFRVQFESTDPQLAATAANALADLYIEELLQSRLDIYAKANQWLVKKLGNVENEMSSAESALQDFRDNNNLLNVGGNRGLAETDLIRLTEELRKARRERSQIENAYREIREITAGGKNPADARPLLADDVIRDAWRSLAAADAQLQSLEKRYGKRHPEYVAARSRKDALQSEYLDQLESQARSIKSKLDIARRTEANLQADKSRAEQKMRSLDQSEFKLNMLERDVTTNQQLYDLFLARFQQSESNSSFNEANARIADPAIAPRKPFAPNPTQYAFLGACLGVVLALLLTVLRELLRSKIETPDELEAICSLPLLGVLPRAKSKQLENSAINLVRADARAPFADAIRSVKTAVVLGGKLQNTSGGGSVLAVTSTEPGEGKTTLTAAMAATFADSSKVLIVDADMRRPRMARQFRRRNTDHAGLAELLQGKASAEDILIRDGDSNLYYVPSGKPPPNPALLLESPTFTQAVQSWRETFDYIFVDTPPLLAASDALHLSQNVDTFILLARAEKTHKKSFLGALKRMEAASIPCMGVVLNDASTKRAGYTGYYYYSAGYRY